MKEKIKRRGLSRISTLVSILGLLVGSTLAAIGKNGDQLGTIAVDELAGWMIQGRIDFRTLYIAETPVKIEKMEGLICIVEDGALSQALNQLPRYKKWVVVTPQGQISPETVNVLSDATDGDIFLLDGGKKAWDEKILAPSLSGLSLNEPERIALDNVRPFFQEDAPTVVKTVKSHPIRTAHPSQEEATEEEEEPEEEEGC